MHTFRNKTLVPDSDDPCNNPHCAVLHSESKNLIKYKLNTKNLQQSFNHVALEMVQW